MKDIEKRIRMLMKLYSIFYDHIYCDNSCTHAFYEDEMRKEFMKDIKNLIEEVCLEVICGNVNGVITYSNKEIALKLIEAQRQRLKKLL